MRNVTDDPRESESRGNRERRVSQRGPLAQHGGVHGFRQGLQGGQSSGTLRFVDIKLRLAF